MYDLEDTRDPMSTVKALAALASIDHEMTDIPCPHGDHVAISIVRVESLVITAGRHGDVTFVGHDDKQEAMETYALMVTYALEAVAQAIAEANSVDHLLADLGLAGYPADVLRLADQPPTRFVV
jgi:hypothetical protein